MPDRKIRALVAKPGLVKAYILFAPISIDYRDNFEKWIAKRRPELAELIVWKYGSPKTREQIRTKYGTPKSNPKFWDNVSVKTFIENVQDSVAVHHGTADDSVPIEWSDKLVAEFKKNGKHIGYYKYKDGKHEFIKHWPQVMERTVFYFDTHLKGIKY